MAKQILFFHGGGSEENFHADAAMAESIQSQLGDAYIIDYPFLPNDGTPDLGRRRQISSQINAAEEEPILIAHSFGASMILVCLSEKRINKKIAAIFLLATPYWTGTEDWVQHFKLKPGFAEDLDSNIPLFFYHCRDDEEVPFEQMEKYKTEIAWAEFRELPKGGHQFNNNLSVLVDDIKAI